MTRIYTQQARTAVQLIRHMRARGWEPMDAPGQYRHGRTKKEIDLNAVEDDGRLHWEQYAAARVTPSPF